VIAPPGGAVGIDGQGRAIKAMHGPAPGAWPRTQKKTPAEAGVLVCSKSAEDQNVIDQLLM
jgi:hypothetical protein